MALQLYRRRAHEIMDMDSVRWCLFVRNTVRLLAACVQWAQIACELVAGYACVIAAPLALEQRSETCIGPTTL